MLKVKNYGELDYNDWKLGVTNDSSGWVSARPTSTPTPRTTAYYTLRVSQAATRTPATSTVVLPSSKTF